MHSNYIMYTIPTNGNQINAIPNTSNINMKQHPPRINSTITNSTAPIRSNPLQQNITQQPTMSLQNIQNNGQNSMPNDINMCQICCQTFQKPSGLKKHMKVHQASPHDEDNSPYKCNACKIDYLNAVTFEEHIKTEHGQPQAFKCVDCGCFRSVELHTPQPFRCEGCSQRKSEPFEAIGTINYRINSSRNAQNSQQVHVSYAKTPKLELDMLVQTMRNGSESNGRRRKLHQCPDCNKCYKHQSTLAMHKKIHSGEYKYKCQYCQKEFYLAEYYNRHLRVHTHEKPFKCDVCDKAFSQSNTLIQHKRIHTGKMHANLKFNEI